MTKNININAIVFISVICLAFLAIFYVSSAGKKQDSAWLADYNIYEEARQSYIEVNLAEAAEQFGTLLAKPAYQDSATINLYMAATLRQMHEYEKAFEHFEKARTKYPAVVNEPLYLQEYALAMHENGKDADAVRYLQRMIDIAKNDDDIQRAKRLMEELPQKSK